MNIFTIRLLRTLRLWALGLMLLTLSSTASLAQGPGGKDFGFGLILYDPLGATVKIWTSSTNAFTFAIGAANFGPTRLDADYLWHFDPFHSRIVKMYAAPGLALAFGNGNGPFGGREFERADNGTGIAARIMFGLNVIPERTPVEIFLELGPIIGISPSGAALDAGLGVRFYP